MPDEFSLLGMGHWPDSSAAMAVASWAVPAWALERAFVFAEAYSQKSQKEGQQDLWTLKQLGGGQLFYLFLVIMPSSSFFCEYTAGSTTQPPYRLLGP